MSSSRIKRLSQVLGIGVLAVGLAPSAALAKCAYTTAMSDRYAEHYLDQLSAAVDESNDFLSHAVDACESPNQVYSYLAAGQFIDMLGTWSKVPDAQCMTVPDKYFLRELWIGAKGVVALVRLQDLNNRTCK
jgi:hypothetical protein